MLPILLLILLSNTIFKRYSEPIFVDILTSDNFVLNKYTALQMQQHLDTKFNKLNPNHVKYEMNGFGLTLNPMYRLDSILPNKIDVSPSSPTLMNPSPNQSVSVPSSVTYKLFHLCNKQSASTTNLSMPKVPNLGMILKNSSSKKT